MNERTKERQIERGEIKKKDCVKERRKYKKYRIEQVKERKNE